MTDPTMRACWCGNADLTMFNSDYMRCTACETLVVRAGPTNVQLQVNDDETDFYGKQYWLGHQKEDLGFADIEERARSDLAERNLYWFESLLKYRLPAADLLELGCAHGSFLALARQAGYRATGVEVSPWVVAFGQSTFGVPIELGPIETLGIAAGSLDVIMLMDVLEHLHAPLETMRHCLTLLRPAGILLIQTPRFKPGSDFDALVASNDRFTEMLIPDEHLYLFSEAAATTMFQNLGATHVCFEPALFPWYDMFFAVSRLPFKNNSRNSAEAVLKAMPGGRIVLALLDLRRREADLITKIEEAELDRAARGDQIETLTGWLKHSETDRAARLAQIQDLTALLKAADVDLAERTKNLEEVSVLLEQSDADRAARGEQINTLTAWLKESEADRAARGEQITTLTTLIQNANPDRARGRP